MYAPAAEFLSLGNGSVFDPDSYAYSKNTSNVADKQVRNDASITVSLWQKITFLCTNTQSP